MNFYHLVIYLFQIESKKQKIFSFKNENWLFSSDCLYNLILDKT
jgi:hypothetical protein